MATTELKPIATEFIPIATRSARTSHVKINILLDSMVFVAGQSITGRLEVICSGKNVRLGEIAVELNGCEEILDKTASIAQSFLSSRIVFQGQKTPPSNAVHGPRDEVVTWPAKKGKTMFPFSFRVPVDAPSSYYVRGASALRYQVTGCLQFSHGGGRPEMIFKTKDTNLVQVCKKLPEVMPPVKSIVKVQGFMGQFGELCLSGEMPKGFAVSGGDTFVKIEVENKSKRAVQATYASLIRRVRASALSTKPFESKIYEEAVSEIVLRSSEFTFDPGETRSALITINVPTNVRTIVNSALATVECFVCVKLEAKAGWSLFNETLTTFEIPCPIFHSASLEPPAEMDQTNAFHPDQYNLMDSSDEEQLYCGKIPEPKRSSPCKIIGKKKRGLVVHDDETENSPPGRALPWKNGVDVENDETSYNIDMCHDCDKRDHSVLRGRSAQSSDNGFHKVELKSPLMGPVLPTAYLNEETRQGPLIRGLSPRRILDSSPQFLWSTHPSTPVSVSSVSKITPLPSPIVQATQFKNTYNYLCANSPKSSPNLSSSAPSYNLMKKYLVENNQVSPQHYPIPPRRSPSPTRGTPNTVRPAKPLPPRPFSAGRENCYTDDVMAVNFSAMKLNSNNSVKVPSRQASLINVKQ